MNDTHITFRKIATGAATGLVSFVVAGFLFRALVRYFAGSPAWEFPATICGAIAFALFIVLAVLPAIGARPRKGK